MPLALTESLTTTLEPATQSTAMIASSWICFGRMGIRRGSPFRWFAKESLLAAGGGTVDCEPVLLPALQLNEGL